MNEEDLLKLEKIVKLFDDPTGVIFEDVQNLALRLDELEKEQKLTRKEVEFIKKVLDSQELLDAIAKRVVVSPGDKGEPGEDYILTETDKKDIAQKITIPIVEKVIEIQKIETIIEKPTITKVVKEVALATTGEEVRDKLASLIGDDRLDASAIKGLPEIQKAVAKPGPAVGPSGLKVFVGGTKKGLLRAVNFVGSGITLTHSLVNGLDTITFSGGFSKLTPTGTVNGVNKTFVFTTAPSLVVVDQGRLMQKTSSDGTVNWTGTTTITLSIAPNFDIYGF